MSSCTRVTLLERREVDVERSMILSHDPETGAFRSEG
jgi:hypothetical protein